MRDKIIFLLKHNPLLVRFVWKIGRSLLQVLSTFIPVKNKTIIFCSLGGRNFGDSPRAIYEEICGRKEFSDWKIQWAFVNPDEFQLKRGKKIKIDTINFFYSLLYSRVWVSNSGMDRGIDFKGKKNIRVETWHGTPLKKIGGEEHQNSIGFPLDGNKTNIDRDTIRCAQSLYDREIFARVNNADLNSVLLCGLPRNDSLLRYEESSKSELRNKLNLPPNKKIILYAPTYREYLINGNNDTYLKPPIDFYKWENVLGKDYVLLLRAHYAVTASLKIPETDFVKDVSHYPNINELLYISDFLISDYSGIFVDFSILDRPMFCFAYDYKEYILKRGLYLDLQAELPCPIDYNEDSLLEHIVNVDYDSAVKKTIVFHNKYATYAGNASKIVVDTILSKLNNHQ